MNKKIASEFAIGVIILVAFVMGGIFWLEKAKQDKVISQPEIAVKAPKVEPPKQEDVQNDDSQVCKPHYYEGEGDVKGWFISEEKDGIIIAISKEDALKLPIADDEEKIGDNFEVKLIDTSQELKEKVKESSQKNPTIISLHGYAEVCQQPPLVSLQPATVAFKKKS